MSPRGKIIPDGNYCLRSYYWVPRNPKDVFIGYLALKFQNIILDVHEIMTSCTMAESCNVFQILL
jgi:hypothetical protein